jgi:hypothetical protein
MISISDFKEFLIKKFNADELYIDEFKPGLQFAEVDCFKNQTYKLSIEMSTEDIKMSTIEKNATLDFSLHEYIFQSNKDAETFIKDVCAKGAYIRPT